MSDIEDSDAVVIGAGQAGPFLAMALAARGERVALVEAQRLGGTCVNTGCTPTKTLRASARVAHMARRAAEYGVRTGPVEVDFAAAMQRMQDRVDAARGGLEKWVAGEARVTLHKAWGRFAGRDGDRFVVEAGPRRLRAPRVYLNTGTRPFVPPIPGLDTVPHLDNVSLLALRERPRHLLVIGGSYIGLEMGQIFRRLGSEVTVVETGARITAREDEDISQEITAFLEAEGIRVLAGRAVERVERDGGGVALVVAGGERIAGSHVLVATGRLPNTESLNLQAVGVKADERGYVPTDGRLQTNVPGIWALGDINKRGAFTHTSYHDQEIVLANHTGGDRSADGRTMAYAMFTDPPLGRVGMSLAEARASGRKVLVADYAMRDVSRAKEDGETTGRIRLLVDAGTERFLGATFLGMGGDEIVQVISNFMATGASYRVLKEALPVHPTVTEFLPTILGRLKPLD
jgi:pyruvate/2-oxoglutarate dehydrogenase complex dihydrolipoamide dehydrogenase (E3) component